MHLSRRIFTGLLVIVLLFAGYYIYTSRQDNRRTLIVNTTSAPIVLELNDESFDITEDGQEVSLEPGVYRYRSSMKIEGTRIVLSNKVDLTEEKSAEINLNFSIYNNLTISETICNSYSPTNCPITPENIIVTYVDNYQWAVVLINSSRLGKSKAILNIDSYTGDWILAGGPETDPPSGYFPESVVKVLNNE